jgi:hypothetical protein
MAGSLLISSSGCTDLKKKKLTGNKRERTVEYMIGGHQSLGYVSEKSEQPYKATV